MNEQNNCRKGWSIPLFIPLALSGITLCMQPAKERWSYSVTPYLIGWMHTQNDPNIFTYQYLSTMHYRWSTDGQRNWIVLVLESGPQLNIKTVFSGMRILIIKIRQSPDRLIFIMGIPILVRRHLYTEMGPECFGIIRINTVAADALAPWAARPSAGMMWTVCSIDIF